MCCSETWTLRRNEWKNCILLLNYIYVFLRGPASKVRVGLINLLTPGGDMQERNVVERIKYPDYKFSVSYHDIALLKLEQPLKLNPQVRPACLEIESQLSGKSAIASGFGKTSYGQYLLKSNLQYAFCFLFLAFYFVLFCDCFIDNHIFYCLVWSSSIFISIDIEKKQKKQKKRQKEQR